MNNTELHQLFYEISAIENSFDKFLKLKEIKKAYKTSDFYKTTKMPYIKAYEWFVKQTIVPDVINIKQHFTPTKIGQFINDCLDSIAPEAVEDLMERIVSYLNTTELIKASTDLGEQIQSLKR